MTISPQLTPLASPSLSGPIPSTREAQGRRGPHPRRTSGRRWPPAADRHDHDRLERPTADLATEPASTADAFALLDHRTRSRSVALADAPPGRYLSAEDGEEIRLVPLDQPIIHIGRGLGADVRVEDPQVSRRHAIIAQRGDGARVLDDRSSNGTHVNGRPVTIGYLHDGDVLRMGRVVLRFVEIGSPVRARPVHRLALAAIAPRRMVPSG